MDLVKEKGFSLLELAITLLVLSILTSATLPTLEKMHEKLRWNNNQEILIGTERALLAFLLQHGRLPCPDTNNDGFENNTNQFCDDSLIIDSDKVVYGTVPYLDLGSSKYDNYGSSIKYAVTKHYADTVQVNALSPIDPTMVGDNNCPLPLDIPGRVVKASMNTCSKGSIIIYDEAGERIAHNLPYVLWSEGENHAIDIDELGPSEKTNRKENRRFVFRPPIRNGKNYYDDQLIWTPSSALAFYLFEARLLP